MKGKKMSKTLNKLGLHSTSTNLKRAISFFIEEQNLSSLFTYNDLRHLLDDYCKNKLKPVEKVVQAMKEENTTIEFSPSSSNTLDGFLENVKKEIIHVSSEENIVNIDFSCDYPDFENEREASLHIKHLVPETNEDYELKVQHKQMVDFLLDNYQSIKEKALFYQDEVKNAKKQAEIDKIQKQIKALEEKAKEIENS